MRDPLTDGDAPASAPGATASGRLPASTPASPRSWRDDARSILALIAVSLGAAAFAMAFRATLQLAYRFLLGGRDVLEAFSGLPPLMRAVIPTCGALAAGVVGGLAARGSGQGVGDVMEAVAVGRVQLSVRRTLWKALGSWIAIATGSSIGREGPLIQFGGGLGALLARRAGVSGRRARALIAAGTAAGFAAAYNTPFAAILFVVEVVAGVVAVDALMMVMVATAIATFVVRASVGGGPIYGERAFSLSVPSELVSHVALGVAAALVARTFMAMLSRAETLFARWHVHQPWRAALGGLAVGLLAIALPEVTGNGYEPLNRLLDAQYALGLVAVLLLAKAVATVASVASGTPGGVFTPSLFLGSALGMLWGHATLSLVGVGSPGSYALVGMAAMTAATTHAPLMASVLVFELSGDYAIVLPLVLATAMATWISRRLHPDSIYTAELRRRGLVWRVTLEGRQFENRKVD